MSAPRSLAGQVALITGAARGIGRESARRLAERGASIALVGLEPDRLAALADSIGERAAWWEADVTDSAALDTAVAGAVDRFGGIDVVMANAGVVNFGTIRSASVAEFARTVDVNLTGVYRTVAAAIDPIIERKGYVLMVASLASYSPMPGGAAYAASKAGVDSLAASLRLELERYGVTVGSGHPGWIDTDLVRGAEAAMPSFRTMRQKLPWPARSLTSVEECADALADAVARRAVKVHVPKSTALIAASRSLIMSPRVQGLGRKALKSDLDRLDREITATRKRATT